MRSLIPSAALTFGAALLASAASAQSLEASNNYVAEYADGSTITSSLYDSDSSFAFTSLHEAYGSGYGASNVNGILGAQAVAGRGGGGGAVAMRGAVAAQAMADDTPLSVTTLGNAVWETTVTNTGSSAVEYTFIFHVYGPTLQTAVDSGEASVFLNIASTNGKSYAATASLDTSGLTSDTAFGAWSYSASTNEYRANSFDASLSLGAIGVGESFTLTYTMGAYAFATDMDSYSYAYIGDPFGWENGPDYQMITNAVPGGPTGAVPEPASWAMLIAGFGLMGVALRRRREMATA